MTLRQVEIAVQQTVQDALTNLAEIADVHESDCPVSEQAESSIRSGVREIFYDQIRSRQKDEIDLRWFRTLFGPLLNKAKGMSELEAYRAQFGPFVSHER